MIKWILHQVSLWKFFVKCQDQHTWQTTAVRQVRSTAGGSKGGPQAEDRAQALASMPSSQPSHMVWVCIIPSTVFHLCRFIWGLSCSSMHSPPPLPKLQVGPHYSLALYLFVCLFLFQCLWLSYLKSDYNYFLFLSLADVTRKFVPCSAPSVPSIVVSRVNTFYTCLLSE